jgi:hypothetical protein
MAADAQAGRHLAPSTTNPSSVSRQAFRRHAPEVGAVCGNPARTDLGGGRSVMTVPTALRSELYRFWTRSGHRSGRNPAAQQDRGVLFLSFQAREVLGSETARVHHAARRRGVRADLAVHRACAAGGGDRISQRRIGIEKAPIRDGPGLRQCQQRDEPQAGTQSQVNPVRSCLSSRPAVNRAALSTR